MANKCAIDTNILLRLILNDIPEQTEAAIQLISTPGMKFWVFDQVITEAVYVLCNSEYSLSRKNAIDKIAQLLAIPSLEYSQEIFDEVFDMFVKHPKLSFNDCYLACKAEKEKRLPLFTLDQKLAKQAKTVELLPLAKIAKSIVSD